MTRIAIAHRPETIHAADRVIRIVDGKLVMRDWALRSTALVPAAAVGLPEEAERPGLRGSAGFLVTCTRALCERWWR